MDPKQKSLADLQQKIDDFNSKKQPGDKVEVNTHTQKEPIWVEATVTNKATIMGGHSAVGWFAELVGCYCLDFVKY